MKKTICLLLSLILAASAVSCSSSTENAETDGSGEAQNPCASVEPEAETEPEKPFLDNLPDDLNFQGEICNMLIRSERIADMSSAVDPLVVSSAPFFRSNLT